MAASKPIRLLLQLLQKSHEGKVKWEKTVEDGEFQAAFPGFSVRLSTRPSHDTPDDIDYLLSIFNEQGELIEVMSDSDLLHQGQSSPPAYKLMAELYGIARRTAMGVEQALDAILEQLEEREDMPF